MLGASRDSKFCRMFCFGIFLSVGIFVFNKQVAALPWDMDMYSQESLSHGEIARAPATGTVPRGRIPLPENLDEFEKSNSFSKNPRTFLFESVASGKRLWSANCMPCHGAKADGDAKVGKLIGAPNLLLPLYSEKTDKRIFGVITYGLRGMPRLGYKISETEKWDIINYLRYLQGRDLKGLSKN